MCSIQCHHSAGMPKAGVATRSPQLLLKRTAWVNAITTSSHPTGCHWTRIRRMRPVPGTPVR
jgi:hypothetical protein